MKFTAFILRQVANILYWTNDSYEKEIIESLADQLDPNLL